jgi:hypothetical protein
MDIDFVDMEQREIPEVYFVFSKIIFDRYLNITGFFGLILFPLRFVKVYSNSLSITNYSR